MKFAGYEKVAKLHGHEILVINLNGRLYFFECYSIIDLIHLNYNLNYMSIDCVYSDSSACVKYNATKSRM